MAKRASLIVLVACVCGLVFSMPAQAKTKSWAELSYAQRDALGESEERLALFDRQLAALDSRLIHRKISSGEYGYEKHDLTALIAGEAEFQNAILTKDSNHLSEEAGEVLGTIAKYAVLVPVYALEIAARGAYNFSP